MPTSLGILVALLLVLANAFFVASEFAIVKMRPTRLEELARRGNRRARTALAISRRLDAYLSANQLGITLASLALGWVGEEAFAELLRPLFGTDSVGTTLRHSLATAMSFTIITFLHTVLGELAPKSLAIQQTEPVALWTAFPLRAFYVAAFPVIWVLNAASNLVLRLFGLQRASEVENLHSPHELRLVLQHVPLDPSARRLIDRVFDYTRHVARHVMTLRSDIVTLDAERPFRENLHTALASQYTRYPLVEGSTGQVLGYVHLKDLLPAVVNGTEPDLRRLVRQPIYARDDEPLEALRREIQRRRVHLVIVRDADDNFVGVLTLEDLVEEFLGEIQDEQDAGEIPPLVRRGDGGFEADGRLTLDVLTRELQLPLEEHAEGAETLGGYLMARLGRVPEVGDSVEEAGYRLIVTQVRERRVSRVRGEPLPKPPEPSDEDR